MEEITVSLSGMTCPSCMTKIQKAVEGRPGVSEVKVLFNAGKVKTGRPSSPNWAIRSTRSGSKNRKTTSQESMEFQGTTRNHQQPPKTNKQTINKRPPKSREINKERN